MLGDKVTSIRPSWTGKLDATGVFETSWAETDNADDGLKTQRGWRYLYQPEHAGGDKNKTFFKHHLQAGVVPNAKLACAMSPQRNWSFCCFNNQTQRITFSKFSCAVYPCSVPRGWRLQKMLDCFLQAPLKPPPTLGIQGKSESKATRSRTVTIRLPLVLHWGCIFQVVLQPVFREKRAVSTPLGCNRRSGSVQLPVIQVG